MNTINEQLDLLDAEGILYTPIYTQYDKFHLAICTPKGYERDEDNKQDPLTILISKGISIQRYDLESFTTYMENDKVALELIVPTKVLLDDILDDTINGQWAEAQTKYKALNILGNEINEYIDNLVEMIKDGADSIYLSNLAYLGYICKGKEE